MIFYQLKICNSYFLVLVVGISLLKMMIKCWKVKRVLEFYHHFSRLRSPTFSLSYFVPASAMVGSVALLLPYSIPTFIFYPGSLTHLLSRLMPTLIIARSTVFVSLCLIFTIAVSCSKSPKLLFPRFMLGLAYIRSSTLRPFR